MKSKEVWAHTLVKNEENWLWYSVNSVIKNVDKLLLWDTGSTDASLLIEKALTEKYPDKIIYRKTEQSSAEDFTKVRQEMLDATKGDWFLMLDADEIWWRESIEKVVGFVRSQSSEEYESVVVPTINLVGDIFHYQGSSAGKYRFGNLRGHYNLRMVKTNIPGLRSLGSHGVWGWADGSGKMIQDRNLYKFIDAPYLHATNLVRSPADSMVIKRKKKFRYEIGESFPFNYFYPEVFFENKPDFVSSPWSVMESGFKFRAFFETPLRKINRAVFTRKVGY